MHDRYSVCPRTPHVLPIILHSIAPHSACNDCVTRIRSALFRSARSIYNWVALPPTEKRGFKTASIAILILRHFL